MYKTCRKVGCHSFLHLYLSFLEDRRYYGQEVNIIFFFLPRTEPRGLNGNLKAHQGGSCRIHGPVRGEAAAAASRGSAAVTAVGRGPVHLLGATACVPAAVTALGRGATAAAAAGRGAAAAATHLQDYQLDHTYDPVAADDQGNQNK